MTWWNRLRAELRGVNWLMVGVLCVCVLIGSVLFKHRWDECRLTNTRYYCWMVLSK